jgi:histone acetyltransferase (RNA polymerase elongator complex component)
MTASTALSQLGDRASDAEIAFFGGSFTAIEPGLMEALLAAAAPYVGPGKFKGIRLSTRPDAISDGILDTLARYGVTSIELGAQSMDDRVLKMNGRGHTSEAVETASRLIKSRGFELGLQMMTGLYGDTPDGARETARRIAALSPATVRIYPTIVLRGTQLERLKNDGLYQPESLGEAVELCAGLLRFFGGKGIKVIRLGLHASDGIAKEYAGGPWHPAFRELCESENYRRSAQEALDELRNGGEGCESGAELHVAPRCVSKLAGQHRTNILALGKETGLRLKIVPDAGVPEGEVKAEPVRE